MAELFQNPEMDWTSASWRQQFLASWQKGTAATPAPTSELQFMHFATYLALKGLAWQTMKSYLAGTKHYRMLDDLSTPFRDDQLPRLQLLMLGIKRISSRSATSHPHLPITLVILH